MRLEDFKVGDRVELRPEVNPWLSSIHCGTVTAIGRDYVELKLDAIVMNTRVPPGNVSRILEQSQKEMVDEYVKALPHAGQWEAGWNQDIAIKTAIAALVGATIAAVIAWLIP